MNNAEKNNFKNFSISDTHFHLVYPETLDSSEQTFREIMEYFSMNAIDLQCIAMGSGHRGLDPANNIKGLYLRERLNGDGDDRAFVYGSLLHRLDGTDTAENYLAQVKYMYDMGFDGYKMLEGKPSFRKKLARPLCDPIFDQMYAFMEETGMPLKMHLADPPMYWGPKENLSEYAIQRGWWCGDGTYPSFDEMHEEIYSILKKFPRLKLCMAHFFFLGHDLDAARRFLETWENTSLDLTPGASMFRGFTDHYDQAKKFFEDFSDRIYFGSDTYNSHVAGEGLARYEAACLRISQVRNCLEKSRDHAVDGGKLGTFSPLALSDEQLKKIYYENHQRLHPAARKINRAMAKSHAEGVLADLENGVFSYNTPEENELEKKNLRQIVAYFS